MACGRGWAVALLLLAEACAVERVGRDGECSYNSECQEALVCAGGRCRVDCREDRDCDLGWRCAPSGVRDRLACQPPDEPARCAFNSECPDRAVCLEHVCRAECHEDRDCLDGTRCDLESRTCESPLTTGVPDGGLVDGGPEAGLVCAQGRVTCGTSCVDLASSPSNCGACGNRCPTNEVCSHGACECDAPQTVCGAACVNLRVDEANCGSCGARCDGPCNQGMCCGAGHAYCGGTCIDVSADDDNCGDCGQRCDGLGLCNGGHCVAINDECEGAYELVLTSGAPTEYRIRPKGQSSHSMASCSGEDDLFYSFTLPQREVVLIRVNGRLVSVGLVEGACGSVTCPDPVCGASDPNATGVVRVLEAGRHVFVVGARDEGSDEYSIRIEHLPVASDSPTALMPPPPPAPDAGAPAPIPFSYPGVLAAGPSSPGSCGPGPDRAYYWVSCPGAADGTLTASTCGAEFESVLSLVRASGAAGTCDVGSCPGGARLETEIRGGSGLHVLYVDSLAADAAGAFTLTGSLP